MSREEHQLQCTCITWFRYNYKKLEYCLFSVPNGFWVRGASRLNLQIAMNYLKDEGLTPGIPDLIFLYNGKTYGIEIKLNKEKSQLNESQIKVHESWKNQGIDTFIVRTFEDFQELIIKIIKNEH